MSISEFQELGALGKGSFASVVKVERKCDGQVYAMKKVHFGNKPKQELYDTLNEIRFLASLKHENIVGLYEVFEVREDEAICLILEFCELGDLQKQIERCKKREAEI
mmetsp:Transcript_12014/g.21398  ORF Transcript_12014/g.21398 Transcript_12014/m.21398 type:complete len:107 (-) Transcript_12014:239-559(-)